MKAIDSIKNWFKSITAMAWLWVGSITVFLSVVLQIFAPYYPSLPLATLGLALNAISVPFTIVQAYRSAREVLRCGSTGGKAKLSVKSLKGTTMLDGIKHDWQLRYFNVVAFLCLTTI